MARIVLFLWSQGSQVGVVVVIHASNLHNPGLNPGLRTSAEICQSQFDSEGFSPGILQFFSCCKLTFKIKAVTEAIKTLASG